MIEPTSNRPTPEVAAARARSAARPSPAVHAESCGTDAVAGLARAMTLFADHDAMRLATYRRFDDVAAASRIVDLPGAPFTRALAWREVGYFNRVYGVGPEALARPAELLAPYRELEVGHPVVLIAAPGVDLSAHAGTLAELGFLPGPRYVRLAARPRAVAAPPLVRSLAVRPPLRSEREAFLRTYLRGFAAEPLRLERAVSVMRGLFERPELSFLLATWHAEPAGIGMVYRPGGGADAFLAAGAVLPERRGRGIHGALIAARLAALAVAGVRRVFTWAIEGDASHRNLARAGFATLRVDQAYVGTPGTA